MPSQNCLTSPLPRSVFGFARQFSNGYKAEELVEDSTGESEPAAAVIPEHTDGSIGVLIGQSLDIRLMHSLEKLHQKNSENLRVAHSLKNPRVHPLKNRLANPADIL